MSKSHKFLFVYLAVIIGALFIGSLLTSGAKANPSGFPITTCETSNATSSGALLTASASSSVIICDAYNATNQGYTPIAFDSGTLGIQLLSFSTASTTLNITTQYSNDGIDWYGDDTGQNIGTTTSGTTTISTDKVITWVPAASGVLYKKLIDIKTPTRFIKIIFTNPSGISNPVITSASTTVWAQLFLKQEIYQG